MFATLHTQSAPQTIDRVIDAFPAAQQGQIRVQLAATLQGIVTQNLVPTADGRGRVAALEILIPDDAVRNLIRQAKIEQVYSVMQTSTSRGMMTMEQSLAELVQRRIISTDIAYSRSSRPDQLAGILERAGISRHARRSRPCSSRSWRRAGFPTAAYDWQVRTNNGLEEGDQALGPDSEAEARRRQVRAEGGRETEDKGQAGYVGVKVGASQIAAAQVHNNGGSKLVKLAREPLEPGVVVGGEVKDIIALSRALDEFFKKHDLPRKGVRLGIGTNRVGVRVLDVDGIDDEKQLANAVTFRAHEALSIPMDQAVMDYHVVGSQKLDNGDVSHRVILAAAYREPIDQFAAAFDAADIQLEAIDVEAFALLRAVSPKVARRRR